MTDRPPSGPSDYLAAERTFLAWIRTGLALMGFGFVVARFGLFLQAMQIGQSNYQVCARNHIRLVQELNQGGTAFSRPSSLAIAVAALLAVLGLAMAIYLISVREPSQEHLETSKEKSMTSDPGNGIVTIPSQHSVDQTVERLEKILQGIGVKLFALIDHSGEAEKVGLHMRPTKLLMFGNPKAGTPLMLASPSVAIDLPLKVLVSEDANGKVWTSFNSPTYIQARHGLSQDFVQNIAIAGTLAAKASE
jgi:uncharacterized protein (DUF302 family)/uncharacterized membrane protein YidH (DUF202 family)